MVFAGVVQGSNLLKAHVVGSLKCIFYMHLSLHVELVVYKRPPQQSGRRPRPGTGERVTLKAKWAVVSDVRCRQDSVVAAHLPPCLHKGEDGALTGLSALLSKLAVPEEAEASQWQLPPLGLRL